METEILYVSMRSPITKFQTKLDEQKDNWPETMTCEVKPAETRNGKKVYTMTITNGPDTGNVKFVAEQDDVSQDIIFKPMKMNKMSNGFYNLVYNDRDIIGTDEDPMVFISQALREICKSCNGTIAYMNESGPTLVRDGKFTSAIYGLVADDGTVYSLHDVKEIGSYDDSDTEFHIKQPINEWLAEHTDVSQAISKLPTINAKMDFVGKYLIKARTEDMIDSDEFLDIFKQAGLFGFTDNTVKMIYKLIM